MNLKIRFAIWFAAYVAVLLSVSFYIIYYLAEDFRKQDFYMRLRQKSQTTHHLLLKVQEIDHALLKIIDKNNLNALSEQKVLIFDSSLELVYSNIESDTITYTENLLCEILEKKEVRITDSRNYDILGFWEDEGNNDGSIILASAYDNHGQNQLKNLKTVLITTWIFALLCTLYFSYLYVKRIIGKPLAQLAQNVSAIGANNLDLRLAIPTNQDELTLLAISFNTMLDRLEKTVQSQRNFIQYASHELRTPLANMLAVTENALSQPRKEQIYQQVLKSLEEEQIRLIDLTNSLLLISRFEQFQMPYETPPLRIDEVLYNTIEDIKSIYPNYNINIDFCYNFLDEKDLLLRGNEMLLKTAFRNLLENACKYSDNQRAQIVICSQNHQLIIDCINQGKILNPKEIEFLFTHFFRGENSIGKRGSGLGLVIVKRIFEIHQANIFYETKDDCQNIFRIIFSKNDNTLLENN